MKAPIGHIEPHAPLLKIPHSDQLLFKIMTAENLLRSIDCKYLHFNRVDSYEDFLGADPCDGQQTPKDHQISNNMRFDKAPNFSAADYYNQSRSRTYACCFSLENSEYIWKNYANNSTIGKVCITFNFGKLRECLNKTLKSHHTSLVYNGNRCRQFFSLNYGIVQYVDWKEHQVCKERLPNPIIYTYLKDAIYSSESELRISLSALGIGQFTQSNGSAIEFPNIIQFHFNFKAAYSEGIITQLQSTPDCDLDKLKNELLDRGIEVVPE